MNIIDKMVALVSPELGLKRMYSRALYAEAQASTKRGFDGAKSGPRAGNWRGSGNSINADLATSLTTLRNRSRDLIANNPYIKHALKVLVGNMVGTGIVPKFEDKRMADLWATWSRLECDAAGLLGFGGIQAQLIRAIWESGEVLVRYRVRYPEDGLSIPLQLQVLEADFLDSSKTGETDTGFCIAGVQFNKTGQRTGYWLFDRHPGEVPSLARALTSKLIPASEVLHLFNPLGRPGQVRGIPEFAASIWKARDLDDYQEAHAIRKKIEACFAAFVTTSDQDFRAGQPSAVVKKGERRVEELSPGLIEYLRPGEEVEFSNPTGSDGYEETVRVDLRAIAAGADVSYEQLTGDYSQVNFTSGRMGKMEFKTMVEQFQWLVFVPMFCDQVAAKASSIAYLYKKIPVAKVLPASWTAPRIALLDPLREGQGYQVMIEIGVMSRHMVIRELGYDPTEVDAEIAADKFSQLQLTDTQKAERNEQRKELLKEKI